MPVVLKRYLQETTQVLCLSKTKQCGESHQPNADIQVDLRACLGVCDWIACHNHHMQKRSKVDQI